MALLEIAEARSASRLVGGTATQYLVTDGQRQYQELNFARYLIVFFSVEIRLNLWLVVDLPVPVVQLDRATASGAVGCGFEPRRAQNSENRLFTGKIEVACSFSCLTHSDKKKRILTLFSL